MQKSWKRIAIKTATGRFGGFSSERVSESWLFVRKWLFLMAVLTLKHLIGRQLEIALFPVKVSLPAVAVQFPTKPCLSR